MEKWLKVGDTYLNVDKISAFEILDIGRFENTNWGINIVTETNGEYIYKRYSSHEEAEQDLKKLIRTLCSK